MSNVFQRPSFTDGELEIRVDQDGVAIYGTRKGLTKLAAICRNLASHALGRDGTEHVHLEDHGLLTGHSLIAAVAVFDK